MKDIPIHCDPGLSISNEIQITNSNSFWYVVIPKFVRPSDNVNFGRTVALDPGLKAFMTGVDLCGNAVHIGHGNRDHLENLRNRAADAQRRMSEIKNICDHRTGKQWKTFARAKRAFDCATAKMKNCVKELHYQTCAYLTKHYDTIVLPIFSSKQMVKKSIARNHTYNKMLLGLKHFQFRELLRAKCELMGKSLVVCSEMYTSQTCGHCSRLHLKLGNKDVFECPHCNHVAGRDVNAAFNILRFTCAGSLAVHTIHRSLTVVKNVPVLQNNHVFTKKLVEENHTLRVETLALQRRLMQFEGPGAKTSSKSLHPTKRNSARVAKAESSPVSAKESGTAQLTKVTTETLAESFKLAELARHPLVQELKTHLRDLEVDLDRLRQENELLRTELDQYQNAKKPAKVIKPAREDDKLNEEDQAQLRASIDVLLQKMKVLEARYQHLKEKARAKTELLQESTFRIEELTTQLFEAQEQLGAQSEKLQAYSDEIARMRDIQQDLHLVRSENVKLNETIAALSSRPFDAQSKDLQKINLLIAQLEDEKRVLEEDRAKYKADCIAVKRTNDQLRNRVEKMTAEMNDLANKLNRCEVECEQRAMENDVAQLQLRFYTAPGDYNLMSTIGKAIKGTMKQQHLAKRDADTPATSRN
ncbi:hypothetical protein V7S43_015025 [Phytophthora oleae]|uniref:Cas12f1-like TNB domain-containing protein n=1 Tax=Phytophthora oleae TaxID=2107226 RepID=A0ABD3F1C9_9STRA